MKQIKDQTFFQLPSCFFEQAVFSIYLIKTEFYWDESWAYLSVWVFVIIMHQGLVIKWISTLIFDWYE